jgi:hypothetical protein
MICIKLADNVKEEFVAELDNLPGRGEAARLHLEIRSLIK